MACDKRDAMAKPSRFEQVHSKAPLGWDEVPLRWNLFTDAKPSHNLLMRQSIKNLLIYTTLQLQITNSDRTPINQATLVSYLNPVVRQQRTAFKPHCVIALGHFRQWRKYTYSHLVRLLQWSI